MRTNQKSLYEMRSEKLSQDFLVLSNKTIANIAFVTLIQSNRQVVMIRNRKQCAKIVL